MWEQAAAAEKADVEATEGPIPPENITRMIITSLSVPLKFGLQPEMCPETESVKESRKKDPSKMVAKFYYACHKCPHSLQNKISMYTHARHCFSIKLGCPQCQKEYKSSDGIDKHISNVHNGICEVGKEAKDTSMITK